MASRTDSSSSMTAMDALIVIRLSTRTVLGAVYPEINANYLENARLTIIRAYRRARAATGLS